MFGKVSQTVCVITKAIILIQVTTLSLKQVFAGNSNEFVRKLRLMHTLAQQLDNVKLKTIREDFPCSDHLNLSYPFHNLFRHQSSDEVTLSESVYGYSDPEISSRGKLYILRESGVYEFEYFPEHADETVGDLDNGHWLKSYSKFSKREYGNAWFEFPGSQEPVKIPVSTSRYSIGKAPSQDKPCPGMLHIGASTGISSNNSDYPAQDLHDKKLRLEQREIRGRQVQAPDFIEKDLELAIDRLLSYYIKALEYIPERTHLFVEKRDDPVNLDEVGLRDPVRITRLRRFIREHEIKKADILEKIDFFMGLSIWAEISKSLTGLQFATQSVHGRIKKLNSQLQANHRLSEFHRVLSPLMLEYLKSDLATIETHTQINRVYIQVMTEEQAKRFYIADDYFAQQNQRIERTRHWIEYWDEYQDTSNSAIPTNVGKQCGNGSRMLSGALTVGGTTPSDGPLYFDLDLVLRSSLRLRHQNSAAKRTIHAISQDRNGVILQIPFLISHGIDQHENHNWSDEPEPIVSLRMARDLNNLRADISRFYTVNGVAVNPQFIHMPKNFAFYDRAFPTMYFYNQVSLYASESNIKDSRINATNWSFASDYPASVISHEIGHRLGLADEYSEIATHPERKVNEDPFNIMANSHRSIDRLHLREDHIDEITRPLCFD